MRWWIWRREGKKMLDKKNRGKGLVFVQFWPLLSLCPDHEIHPYLYGVEEEHFVFNGAKS